MSRLQRLTTQRTATILIFMLLFALATRFPTDTDTWWHIRSGAHTLSDGFIYEDPFSHTMNGEPWVNHSWGAQILLQGAWRMAGNAGLALYTSVLATAGLFFVYKTCAGNAYVRGFALVLCASTAAVFWSPRPQMTSFFFSTVVLYILDLYKRQGIDRLWWLVPVLLVWGNMHAGFSIAFILLFGFLAGEVAANIFNSGGETVLPWREIGKVVLISVIAAAVVIVNPYGYRMLLVPFQTVGLDTLRGFIQEWQSPNFQETQTWPFVAMLVALIGALGVGSYRLRWGHFFLVCGTMFMSLLAGRNIAVFAVVATPVLSHHIAAFMQERGWTLPVRDRVPVGFARLNLVLLLVIFVGVLLKVGLVFDQEQVLEAQADIFPVDAIAHIRTTQPPGTLFNSYNWGGYLMFVLPEYPVFVDGRTDLYGDAFLSDYIQTVTGRDGWQAMLVDYNVHTVLVESGSGLARALSASMDWTLDYQDDQAVVYLRE